MEKKVVVVLAAILFLCIFTLLNMVSVYYFSIPLSPVALTGRAVDTGLVQLFIEGNIRILNISSPLNLTYDNNSYTCSGGGYPKCDDFRYDLPFNVTANFNVVAVNGWKYSLYDLKHERYIVEETYFDPDITLSAVRWGNFLTVSANEVNVGWHTQNVTFTVEVSNSSPVLGPIDERILVCEGQRISSVSGSSFNASDSDEEILIADITPKNNTFYVVAVGGSPQVNVSLFSLISAPLPKSAVADYNKTISVRDPTGLVDTATTNISVIEINNPPVMTGLGAQTVWLTGVNSSFNHRMVVTDLENGDSPEGDFSFDLTWGEGSNLFGINSTTGVMNYTPSAGHEGKTYSLVVCVNDTALSFIHENISLCSPRVGGIESACDSFSLTVTNINRAPRILNFSPSTTNFAVAGTTATIFNASVTDDDMVNAYPDLDWYVNSVLQEHNENKSSDDYSFTAGCGVSGLYNVTVITSDGNLSDSQGWNVTVANVACPVQDLGGGGSSGGGGRLADYCIEKWVCNDWEVCQNVERSFIDKILSPENYFRFKEICSQNQYDVIFCGFQMTSCQDLELCNNTIPRIPKPSEMQVCYFTEDPSCTDSITNCHDGSCELSVDCGGPCGPCPTCSDKQRNQGEEGIDCGGPCPSACEEEGAFSSLSFVLILLLVIAFIILAFIVVKIFNILRYRFFILGKRRKKRKI